MKHHFRILLTLATIILFVGMIPTGSALAASNDGNVEWDGAGHLPGSNVCGEEALNYRYPSGNPSSAQSVVLRARSWQGDLTGLTLYYTTNASAAVQGDWTSAALSWEANCGTGMDSWIGTIPAQATQVWYKFAYTDGADTDWVRISGEGAAAVSEDEGGWATTSTTLTYTPQAVPNTVYVDDGFNSSTIGWGYDHFATIQNGINAVAAGGSIQLAEGTYIENPGVSNKQVSFTGAVDGSGNPLPTIQGTLTIDLPGADNNWSVENINFIANTTSAALLSLKNVNGVTVSNCTFDGNGRFMATPSVNGINFVSGANGNTNVVVENAVFNNGLYVAIGGTVGQLTLRDAVISNVKSGVNIQSGATTLVVEDTDISVIAQGPASDTYGIRFASAAVGSAVNMSLSGLTISVDKNGLVAEPGTYHAAIIIREGATGTLEAHQTSILGDVVNLSAQPFDATMNWWGSAAGPAAGQITGDVISCPWLDAVPGMGSAAGDTVSNLDTGETFCTIQAAIDDADTLAGHTIEASAGTYTETITINKAVSVTGEAGAIIDGGGSGTVVSISANDVTLQGFTIQNSGTGATDAGVNLTSVSGCAVISNTVTGNANGIGVVFASGNFVTGNTVDANASYGIALVAGTGNTLDLNTVTGNGLDAIALDNASVVGGSVGMGSTGNFIQGNVITSNHDGIFLGENCDGNLITDGNQLTNIASIGISAWRSDGHTITGNTISGAATAIRLLGSSNNTITGNLITGNDVGVKVDASWQEGVWYQSANNTISNNDLSGSTTLAVACGDEQTDVVDVSGNWWGSADPATVSAAANGGIYVDYTPWLESGANAATDFGFQGDFANLWVDDDSPQSGTLGRIQEGVDMVSGSTVNVAAGTYVEQVIINKDLTLLGEDQATTTIQAFASMPVCFAVPANTRPVVCVLNAEAMIDGFTVDGLGLGNSNNRFVGVAFHNAGGTLQNSTVLDIRDTPLSGAQHGVAVYAYNIDGTARTVHVLDNTISGFQKNAMALNAGDTTPLTVDVQRNLVTGAGVTTVTAQNGIQVLTILGGGVVQDNIIDGIAYDGPTYGASSILNYYSADLDIIGNTITGAHLGIYNIDGAGLIAENVMTVIAAGDSSSGIIATDPPQVLPSPYADSVKAPKTPGLMGMGLDALLGLEVFDNTLVFSGTVNTNSFGIAAYGGYSDNDLAINVHHNLVTGFEYGLVFDQCDPALGGCAAGNYTAISAASNDLINSTTGIYLGSLITTTVVPEIHHNRFYSDLPTAVGLENNISQSVTAEDNWWGCNEGPADGTCVGATGLVDADPWLVMAVNDLPDTMDPMGTGTLIADLTGNSVGTPPVLAGYLPETVLVGFTPPEQMDPDSDLLSMDLAETTFTAPLTAGTVSACAVLDGEAVCQDVTVDAAAITWADDGWIGLADGTVVTPTFPAGAGTHIIGYDAFATIQGAIGSVTDPGTTYVMIGTYPEVGQIVINKDLTLVGEDRDTTIVQPTANTGSSGDARGWFLIPAGRNVSISNLTLDGAGYNIMQGIRFQGTGSISNNNIQNIVYPGYNGLGISMFGNVTVLNNTFTNIGRVGVIAYGSGVSSALIENNTFVGKGAGDWLDYAVELGSGAVATIQGNTITNNLGVASSDGSASAGILITTYYGAGTSGTILENTFVNNSMGIAVGVDAADTSSVVAHFNRIVGNEYGVTSTGPAVDATNNWWGCNEGPVGADCDTADLLADADPWLMLAADFDPLGLLGEADGTLSANLLGNSAGETPAGGFVPDTTPAVFTATLGSFDPAASNFMDGETLSTYTAPATLGTDNACIAVDNEQVCFTVEVVDQFALTDLDLWQTTVVTGTWTQVTGTYTDGFTMTLDTTVEYYYLDTENITANHTLADGDHSFYLITDTVPGGFYDYWAAKGVVSGASGWMGAMWEIISGNEPMFYLKVTGSTDYVLVDGFTRLTGRPDEPLKVNGSYWPGTYAFAGDVTDIYGQADDVTVNITFNDIPVAEDQTVITDEDIAASFTLTATDFYPGSLVWTLGDPANGTLSGTAPELTYTPDTDWSGTDTFTFTVNDGTEDSNVATVTITVNAVNDAPVAEDLDTSTDEDLAVDFTLVASDVEDDDLTYTYGTPANGTLSGIAPELTYTPDADWSGTDTFTFTVNDGALDSNTATVTIVVADVIDDPVLSITKDVDTGSGPVNIGDVVTYTISVANTSLVEAQDVHIVDTLPAGLIGEDVDITVTVGAEDVFVHVFTATVDRTVYSGATITNTAAFEHSSGSGTDDASFQMAVWRTIFLPITFKNAGG